MSDLERMLKASNDLYLKGFERGYAQGYKEAIDRLEAALLKKPAKPAPESFNPVDVDRPCE